MTIAPLRYLALLVLGLPASGPSTDVYKWIDVQGETNYSDRQPSGREAQLLRPGTQAAAEPPQATPPDARSEAAFRERKVKAAANDEKLQQASLEGKRRAAECAKEQARVLLLMQPRRLAQQDAQGQPIVLDDDARQRERARSEKFVAENCTPP